MNWVLHKLIGEWPYLILAFVFLLPVTIVLRGLNTLIETERRAKLKQRAYEIPCKPREESIESRLSGRIETAASEEVTNGQ